MDQLVAYLKSIDESSEIISVDEKVAFGNLPKLKVNPTVSTDGYFNYSVTNLKEKGKLVLADLQGKTLREFILNNTSNFEFSGKPQQLRSGSYFLTLKTKSHHLTAKLIV